MLVNSEDGQGKSVYVPDNQSFTLHRRLEGLPTISLRPRTTCALLALTGFHTVGTARFSDPLSFERVESENGLASLDPSQEGSSQIDGRPVGYWKQMLSLFDETLERPPKTIRLLVPRTRTERASAGCSCHELATTAHASDVLVAARARRAPRGVLVLPEDVDPKPAIYALRDTHEYREHPVPSCLLELSVHAVIPMVGDIVVGRGATLTFAADMSWGIVNNFLMYFGARVVQAASQLTLDVQSHMCGSLIKNVYIFDNVSLKIDTAALSKEIQTIA